MSPQTQADPWAQYQSKPDPWAQYATGAPSSTASDIQAIIDRKTKGPSPDSRASWQVLKDTLTHPVDELSKADLLGGFKEYGKAILNPQPDEKVHTGMDDPANTWIGAAVPGGPLTEGLNLRQALTASPLSRLFAGVKHSTTPEDLLVKAAANREAAKAGTSSDIPVTLGQAAKGTLKAAMGPIRNARATLQEKLAQLATAGDVSPSMESVTSTARPWRPKPLNAESPIPSRMLKSEMLNEPPSTIPDAEEPPVARRTPGQPYMKPSLAAQDTQAWLDEQRASMVPHLDTKPEVSGPMREIHANIQVGPSVAAKPDMEAIERAIAPSGRYAKKAAQMMNADGTPTKFGQRLISEVPELTNVKTQADATNALTTGFQRVQNGVIAAENKIPETATVDNADIVQGFRDLAKEYEQFANPKTTAQLEKLVSTWQEKPAQIPWKEFLKSKRAFFNEADTASAPMRRAYGILMDASGKISPELAEANQSYSTVRRAIDNANIDTATGRRIMDVGKAKPSLKQEMK